MITLNAALPLAHGGLSAAYLWKKQYEQAIAEGERAIGLDSNNAESYAQQAEVLSRVGIDYLQGYAYGRPAFFMPGTESSSGAFTSFSALLCLHQASCSPSFQP